MQSVLSVPSSRPYLGMELQDGAPGAQQEHGPALSPQWFRPPPTVAALHNNGTAQRYFKFLSILGSPGRPRWTSACSSGHAPAPAVPHRKLLWPAGRCGAQPGPQPRRGPQVWRPSAPSLPIRGTDPEVRRAAPEVQKGGWSGFTNPKSEAGALKGQPFDSLGPSPDPNPLPLPNSQHPVPSGFHLLPCPKACGPWAERRCFCLLVSLGHHLLNQARPTFMIFLASFTGHPCCGLLALSIITAPNLLGKLMLSLQDPAQSLLLGEARHGLLLP